MRYTDALEFDDEKFRRLTRVKKRAFQEMVAILAEAQARKKPAEDGPTSSKSRKC